MHGNTHAEILRELGQTELARLTAVTLGENEMSVHSRISGWIRRNHIPSRHWMTLCNLADAMGYDLDYKELIYKINYGPE